MVGPIPSATTSALQGIRACMQRMDRAAATLTGAGGDPADRVAPEAEPAAAAGLRDTADLVAAQVEILLAQRAFSAQLRVLDAARRTADEAIRLGENPR